MPGREMDVDRLGAGVVAAIGQLLAQGHHLVLEEVGDARWRAMGTPGAGFEPGLTLPAVADEELVEPAAAHPMGGGQLAQPFPRPQVRFDQESGLVHRRPPAVGCLLCLDTSLRLDVSYVLKSDTVRSAISGCREPRLPEPCRPGRGRVAQLVERAPEKREVRGSMPRPTTEESPLAGSSQETGSMRLFVAVVLPEAVADLVAALPRPERTDLRWTTRAQWHVTLRFLGQAQPDEVIAAVPDALGLLGADAAPVAELGPATAWFAGRRVLQVPVGGLEGLAAAVHEVTQPWGRPDEPPFSGHLTVARTVGRRRGPAELAGAQLAACFAVTEIGVYASRSGPTGSVYQRLLRLPLAPLAAGPDGDR